MPKLVREKQSWRRFSVKAGAFLVILGMVALFFTRFTIAFDPQDSRCLPDHWVYLIDKRDKHLEAGKPYAFLADGLEPVFTGQTQMLKVLKGVPGDTVEVDFLEQVTINGELVAHGLPVADILEKPKAFFVGKGQLAENKYWFMGESEKSFDSRYWGTVTNEQIIGRAYPLF